MPISLLQDAAASVGHEPPRESWGAKPLAVVMVNQILLLAVTLLPAPSRCWCSDLPKVPPNQHLQTELLPFCSPHIPNTFLLCLLFIPLWQWHWHNGSRPPPESWACDTPGTPLGLAWAVVSDYRAEGQTAIFLSELSVGPASQLHALCFNGPALPSTPRGAMSTPSLCSVMIHRSCKLGQCLVVFWTCIEFCGNSVSC